MQDFLDASETKILLPPSLEKTLSEFADFGQRYNFTDELTIYPERDLESYGDMATDFLVATQKYSLEEREQFVSTYREEESLVRERLQKLPNVEVLYPEEEEKDKPNQFVVYRLSDYNPIEDVGRFYLNFSPKSHLEDLEKLIQLLLERKISCDIKTALGESVNSEYFRKTDKVVLYFHPDQQTDILKIVRDFYRGFSSHLDEDIPKLAAQLKDEEGNPMKGIAFGEDPNQEKTREALRWEKQDEIFSFNAVRAALLLLYLSYQKDWGGDRGRWFKLACDNFGVDYLLPAFNLNTPFHVIKNNVVGL